MSDEKLFLILAILFSITSILLSMTGENTFYYEGLFITLAIVCVIVAYKSKDQK
jgi:hypothetical protein